MAAQITGRGLRLAALMRNFGLAPADLAQEDTKAAVGILRSAFFRLAKEQHPDRAPKAKKVEAAEDFVKLKGDLEEAIRLLEHGIRPSVGTDKAWQQEIYSRPGFRLTEQDMQRTRLQPAPKQEFDMKTRIKGNLIFWSGLFVFLTGFREFLVWSAGSCYAWSKPENANPFWVRRFQDGWHAEANDKAPEKEEKVAAKPKVRAVAEKKDRGVSNFYQKRGMSNVRRKTEPRGCGTSF